MRTWLPFLLAALVLAGCASSNSNNNANGGNNTTGGTGATNMTMTTPVGSDTHDFSTCELPAPAPTACATSKALTVPSSVTMLNVTVEWSATQGAPATPIGPDGANVKVGSASCTLPPGPFTGAPKCTKAVAASGVTKIDYSGEGGVSAKVTVTGG